ncbi:hypothetical protein J6590_051408 [Homalodisca vitripennis]|nr:hypothetical protein J6590_051408 [Homalodisca vitripennis]
MSCFFTSGRVLSAEKSQCLVRIVWLHLSFCYVIDLDLPFAPPVSRPRILSASSGENRFTQSPVRASTPRAMANPFYAGFCRRHILTLVFTREKICVLALRVCRGYRKSRAWLLLGWVAAKDPAFASSPPARPLVVKETGFIRTFSIPTRLDSASGDPLRDRRLRCDPADAVAQCSRGSNRCWSVTGKSCSLLRYRQDASSVVIVALTAIDVFESLQRKWEMSRRPRKTACGRNTCIVLPGTKLQCKRRRQRSSRQPGLVLQLADHRTVLANSVDWFWLLNTRHHYRPGHLHVGGIYRSVHRRTTEGGLECGGMCALLTGPSIVLHSTTSVPVNERHVVWKHLYGDYFYNGRITSDWIIDRIQQSSDRSLKETPSRRLILRNT